MNRNLLRTFVLSLCFVLLHGVMPSRLLAATDAWQVFVGTYTGKESKGIYRMELDMKTGALSEPVLAAETPSPSYLALHPKGGFLYAVNEIGKFQGEDTGSVSAFAVADDGGLTFLNDQPSGGAAPCHVLLDADGKHVFVANYTGGSISVYPLEKSGQLNSASTMIQHKGGSTDSGRQKGPHAHGIYLDRGERHVLVSDLGLNQVLVYRFDKEAGSLTVSDPSHATLKPGAGPRHLAMHPRGRHLYVLNEMDCTITPFQYNPRRGKLKALKSISTLPAGESVKRGYSTAEIAVHPSGKFLYSSNRGHDTIAVFAIEKGGSRLRLIEHMSSGGKTPRNFGIDPTGTYLLAANQSSNNVVVFRIDPKKGTLTATGGSALVGKPVCVVFRDPGR